MFFVLGVTSRILQRDIYPRHLCTSIMCRVFLLAVCPVALLLAVCPVALGDVRLLQCDQMEGERTATCEQ